MEGGLKMRKLLVIGLWMFITIMAISVMFSVSAIAKDKLYIPTEGSRTDGAWSQAWFEAYNYLKNKYPDVEVGFSDLCPYPETSAILETQAQAGVNILYLDSFWLEATQKVAAKYPKTWFILRNLPDSLFKTLSDNVATYATKDHQGAFLAGVAAGMVTKTNTIGYVAGVDYPDIIRAGKGFEEGAKFVNPKVKLLVMYTGDWVDVQTGYEAAKALIQAGADVIMHYSDNAGKGVFQAAKEKNIYVVGEARDQVDFAPKLTITSFLINHSKLAEQAFLDYKAGRLTKKQNQFGIEEGWTMIAPIRNVPPAVEKKVNEVMLGIKKGEIKVPEIIDPNALKRMK